MGEETERKYLVKEVPKNLNTFVHATIEQGYIAITNDGMEVRIRRFGEKYFETVKAGKGMTRAETEIELSKQQFESLWALTEGRRVEKTRYQTPYQDLIIELDVYAGGLRNLVIAEVEFPSVEKSLVFEPPEWFGKEVTDDERYKNKNLAIGGAPF